MSNLKGKKMKDLIIPKKILIKALVFIITIFSSCSGQNDYKNKSMENFIDKKTGINFLSIMKDYSGLRELKNEDFKIKGTGTHSYEVQTFDKKLMRASLMIEVFPELTKKGMDLSDFITKLKTYSWIKKENFNVIENIGGELPIKFIEGNTHAVIGFADFPPRSIALYLRVSEKATKDELLFYLQSEQPMDNTVLLRKFKVIEAVLLMEVEQ